MSRTAKPALAANIHAGCVALGRSGILLLGPSGSGKSDLALRLIDGGARLVADDRSELFLRKGALFARAPAGLAGLIEIRGLGIVEFPYCREVRLMLVVRLGAEASRLPQPERYVPPNPLKAAIRPPRRPPLIALDGFAASAPARIRSALAAYAGNLFRDTLSPDKPGNPK